MPTAKTSAAAQPSLGAMPLAELRIAAGRLCSKLGRRLAGVMTDAELDDLEDALQSTEDVLRKAWLDGFSKGREAG